MAISMPLIVIGGGYFDAQIFLKKLHQAHTTGQVEFDEKLISQSEFAK